MQRESQPKRKKTVAMNSLSKAKEKPAPLKYKGLMYFKPSANDNWLWEEPDYQKLTFVKPPEVPHPQNPFDFTYAREDNNDDNEEQIWVCGVAVDDPGSGRTSSELKIWFYGQADKTDTVKVRLSVNGTFTSAQTIDVYEGGWYSADAWPLVRDIDSQLRNGNLKLCIKTSSNMPNHQELDVMSACIEVTYS